ncbi:MAG TPA: phospholipase D-like domain-containing protein [Casimicrobiaceae bacterium]|nr:phospholipase D-like domain-containing protein [Casimicrobiaceae bacterium]
MTWDLTPWGTLYVASEWVLRIAALVLVPQRRTPASARAWLLLILFWPWPGVALYLLVGRAYLPRRRLALQSEVRQTIRRVAPSAPAATDAGWEPSVHWQPGLELAQRRSEFRPVDGNVFELLPDYDAAIARLIADVDGACRYVHLLYYIFENDATGQAVAAALERATRRGVAVRVLADAVGSRQGLRGLGPRLVAAGAEVIPVMPLRLWGPNAARLDLRNHRKIAIVDGETAYFGSQNIVDSHANPGLVNEELAVRAMGPVVRQLLALLLADRYLETGDVPPEIDIGPASPAPGTPGGRAQVLPSGPGHDAGSTEAIMIALMHGARSRVVLTAPYVVPSEAFLGALCSAALRGVAVELIVDSASNKPLVQLAQESYYDEMLAAGVRILRRTGSFLHAKHMSVDDDIVLIGSSNLDIRSFVLNAEVSVLIADAGVAAALHRVQARYRAGSVPVTTAERAALSRGRRTLENLARLTDSVL